MGGVRPGPGLQHLGSLFEVERSVQEFPTSRRTWYGPKIIGSLMEGPQNRTRPIYGSYHTSSERLRKQHVGM